MKILNQYLYYHFTKLYLGRYSNIHKSQKPAVFFIGCTIVIEYIMSQFLVLSGIFTDFQIFQWIKKFSVVYSEEADDLHLP